MNIGITLPHLAPSQAKDEVFDIVNRLSWKGENSYSIFFENVAPNFRNVSAPTMNISDSRFFKGIMIGFTLSSVSFSLNSPNSCETILYSYDLEWLRNNRPFLDNILVYRNPNLKIYTRSKDYANLLGHYSNREVGVISLEELLRCPPKDIQKISL